MGRSEKRRDLRGVTRDESEFERGQQQPVESVARIDKVTFRVGPDRQCFFAKTKQPGSAGHSKRGQFAMND